MTWTVGIGSRLNTKFGVQGNQINEVTVEDVLNQNGIDYLTFPEKDTDYRLYEVKSDGTRGDLIDTDNYDVDWPENSDTNQRTFTITFKQAPEAGYTYLEFEFATPIDLEAWENANKEGNSLPATHKFHNSAVVSYGGDTYNKVTASTEMSSTGIYGKKDGKAGDNNQIKWSVIMNALGRSIGYPTITDELSGNHMHAIDPNDLELSFVTVKHSASGNHYDVEVDEDGASTKLVYGKDYTVEFTSDQRFKITLHTEVNRPLLLTYKTVMTERSTTYTNKVKISAGSQSTEFTKKHEVNSSAFMSSWAVRFQKLDGDTNKPLAGAKFKLQWLINGEWQDAKRMDDQDYDVVTSTEQGYVQFYLLGTRAQYRLVEVGTPDNYDSQMAPIEFNYQRYQAEKWGTKNPEIKNYQVDVGNLTLRKTTKNLPTTKEFNFEVQAVNDDGEVDTNFHGDYELASGGKVTFNNGVSDNIKLTDGQHRTIEGLPIQKVDADGKKSDRKYVVRETSTSADYTTRVTVNDQTTAGTTSPAFTLTKGSATSVMVHFENTAAKGQLQLQKVVSSHDEADHRLDFQFTIKADKPAAVAGNRYEADGAVNQVTFNQQGETTVTLRAGERLLIKDLPEGVNFKVTEETAKKFTTTWSVNGGDYGTTPAEVTIDANQVQLVTFKNSRQPSGQLQIEKHIKGAVATDQQFKFQIETISTLNGAYPYATYHVDTQKPGRIGTLEFENGLATLTLTGQEYAVLSELPLDVTYTVSEIDPETAGMVTTWQVGDAQDEGLVAEGVKLKDANEMANVKFTNALPNGSLRLVKKVTSPHAGDQAIDFEFQIQAQGDDVERVKDREFQVESQRMDMIRFNDQGLATVKLAGGENLEIKGLPAGTKFKVSEVTHDDFQTSVAVDNDDAQNSNAVEVTVKDDGRTTVNYTNTRNGEGHLLLEKRAEGNYPSDKTIEFTIQAADKQLSKAFDAQLTTVGGSPMKQQVTFKEGEATVSFKPGETLLIQHLPVQDYQVIEGTQPDDVVTSWETDTKNGNGLTAEPTAVKADHTSRILFINRIRTGDLTLNKWVASHDASDSDKDFTFKLAADQKTVRWVADKSYSATGLRGASSVKFDRDGQAEVTMKADQQVTIKDLPHGVTFTVTETDYGKLTPTWNVNNQGGYTELTNDHQPEVTIDEEQTQVVSYKNVRDPVGSLRVDKRVTGAYNDDKRAFEFTVTTDLEADDTYGLTIYDRTTNQAQSHDDLRFSDGKASFKLAADQYGIINGLPLGAYTVSETDPEVANMTTTWQVNNDQTQSGLTTTAQTITANRVPQITFTNQLHSGSLVLEKQVTGDVSEADMNQTFTFKVTAQKLDNDDWIADKSFSGEYSATRTTSSGQQTTRVDFDKGELEVHLKANERLQINNLPSDLRLVVTETPASGYITSHRLNGGQVTTGNTSDVVTITDDTDQHVIFINERPKVDVPAWLALTKSVLGEDGDYDRSFDFTVRFLDAQMNPLTGTLNMVRTTKTGGYETSQLMLDSNGSSQLSLAHGETIRWQLPNGVHYQITETDYSADGYTTSVSQGLAPEREGLTVTGVAINTNPAAAKVVYYNRADPVGDDQPHVDDDDSTVPDFVDSLPGSQTTNGTTGTGSTPTSTTQSGGSAGTSKGILPQTGEWLAENWLAVLGVLILVSILGVTVKRMWKRD